MNYKGNKEMHEKLKWHVGKKQIWLSKLYNVENIFRGHKVRCELILQRKFHIKMEADIFFLTLQFRKLLNALSMSLFLLVLYTTFESQIQPVMLRTNHCPAMCQMLTLCHSALTFL